MKIDPTNINGLTNAAANPKPVESSPVDDAARIAKSGAQNGEPIGTDATQTGPGKDRVQLSNLLESLRRQAGSGEDEISPERAAYLDKLGAQVASGNYQVDANKLSARIIDDTVKGIG